MQRAAPPYLALTVREWLALHVTDIWIGHRGQNEWRPISAKITASGFVLWR
jgi:hypothetical protein